MPNEQPETPEDVPSNESTVTAEQPPQQSCSHPLSRIAWENDLSGDEILTQPGECQACGVGVELVYQQVGVRLQHDAAGDFIHRL